MVAFSIALATVGFAIGKTATLMTSWSAGKSLEPPEDLGKFLKSTCSFATVDS